VPDGGMEHLANVTPDQAEETIWHGIQPMNSPGEDPEPGANHLAQGPWPHLHCRPPGGGQDGTGRLSGPRRSVYRLVGSERA
jgi:hypothetical protein